MQQKRSAVRVRALQAREEVAPARCSGLDVFGLVADLFQLFGHPPSALGFAFGGVGFAGVGRVEPDQRADEINHLGFGVGGSSHSHHSYH